jgi:MFS-type transporter involved in bile tolerance (Atg22 family)
MLLGVLLSVYLVQVDFCRAVCCRHFCCRVLARRRTELASEDAMLFNVGPRAMKRYSQTGYNSAYGESAVAVAVRLKYMTTTLT